MKDYGKYLIAPQHHGWSKDPTTGQVQFLDDERWRAAFPDCKFNNYLGTNPADTKSFDSGQQRRMTKIIDSRESNE